MINLLVSLVHNSRLITRSVKKWGSSTRAAWTEKADLYCEAFFMPIHKYLKIYAFFLNGLVVDPKMFTKLNKNKQKLVNLLVSLLQDCRRHNSVPPKIGLFNHTGRDGKKPTCGRLEFLRVELVYFV